MFIKSFNYKISNQNQVATIYAHIRIKMLHKSAKIKAISEPIKLLTLIKYPLNVDVRHCLGY